MQNRYHKLDNYNELTAKLVKKLSAHPDIEIVFLSGSTVYGGRDEYSDIDINIVVSNPEEFKPTLCSLISEVEEIKHSFCPPRLDNIYVFYFKNLEKIDIGLYSIEDYLSGRHALPPNEAIIKNTLGSKVTLTEEEYFPDESFQNKYLSLALADLIAIPREIYRKNIFEARANLDESRSMIATYINIQNSVVYFGYNDFISFANKDQQALFIESLKKNGSYEGILVAALNLLRIIDSTKVFDTTVIELVEKRLQAAFDAA